MNKFDPESMPDSTSPTVRSLRTFVERSIEEELSKAEVEHTYDIAIILEPYLRSLAYNIFHKNPEVHTVAKQNMYAFDNSIKTLFAISSEEPTIEDWKK